MSPVRVTMFLAFGQTAIGCLWLLAWVPRRTIGVNFHRLIAVLAVILLFFAMLARYPAADFRGLLLHGRPASAPGPGPAEFWAMQATFLAAIGFMVALIFTRSAALVRYTGRAAGALGAVALVLAAVGLRGALPRAGYAPLLALTFVLGALATGAVVVGMNLGHWYLMARLPLRPLQRISTVLLAVLAAQSACTVVALACLQRPELRDALGAALRLETMDGLYVWIRLLVGLGFPLLLAYMIRDTARSGSTMSATGLLYIAVLTVFAGEAASRFLLLSTGLWL